MKNVDLGGELAASQHLFFSNESCVDAVKFTIPSKSKPGNDHDEHVLIDNVGSARVR